MVKRRTNRRKKTRKTKKRSRKMKGKGPVFSRSTPPGPPTVSLGVGPHWVKANVQNDNCALCLSLCVIMVESMLYMSCHGHQFHAYCLHELCII